MIDSYGDRPNPCGFCAEGDNSPKDKEYLEFSLCGNETSLFVREISVDDLTKPQEGGASPEDMSFIAAPVEQNYTHPPTPGMTSTARGSRAPKPTKASNTNRQIAALYTKKWSGNTYFEEEIRKLRDKQYDKEVKEALRMRKLWHSFQLQLLKDRRREILRSSGPEWWQEPSPKQIVLATTLRDVIKADYEEEVTGRTRQWLLDLGVATRLTPRQVRRCMTQSMLEPEDFLLEAHARVVRAQQNLQKKADLQRPFSVDERLLLSAVCVLQLPTLLTMLHYVLPPPTPAPTDRHAQEVLYGDLSDESIRYACPYMEPLPFRNKKDFEDWAFGKICSALLPVLIDDSASDLRMSDLSERIEMDLRKSLSMGSRGALSAGLDVLNRPSVCSAGPSIAILLSYCLSKRKMSGSMKVILDEDSVSRRRTFGRRLTLLGGKKQSHPNAEYKTWQTEVPAHSSLKSGSEIEAPPVSEPVPTAAKKENTSVTIAQAQEAAYDEYNWANQPWEGEYNQAMPANAYEYNQNLDQTYYGDYYGNNVYDGQYNYYDNTEVQKPPTILRSTSKLKDVASKTDVSPSSSKITAELATAQDSHSTVRRSSAVEQKASEALDQLKNIWEEIGALPEKEQLQKGLEILSEMGDPLAQLPKIEKLPTLQRWWELRRGKNRILSKKTKQDLVNASRGMWKSVHFANTTRGPKVEITKAEERKLTWDRKKWLEREVTKEKQNYFSRVRQEKVDNARSFFPTMLNHYDYGSRLNRGFRDVYFTYLPGREADTFAYRPWQPSETTNARK